MARLVRHDAKSPAKINEGDAKFPIFICRCGLSREKPFCDGSHKKTRDEAEGPIYVYHGDQRTELPSEYPDKD